MRTFQWLAVIVLMGCSEANDDSPVRADTGAVVDSSSGSDTGSPIDTGASSDTNKPVEDAGAVGAVVINEVRAADGDYVELMNTGTTTLDVGGHGLRGESSDGGTPNEFTFPSGTKVPAGGYLLMYANASTADGGAADCKGAPAAACFAVTWGISSSKGETIRFVDDKGATLSQVTVSTTIPTGQTWGRIPNGTGAFQNTQPTPGAENKT